MKIAQIAPLTESVPPKRYGGTERIVSFLCDELVAKNHEVTLFASGDSVTSAKLIPCSDAALRLNPAVKDQLPHHIVMLEQVRRRAGEFDVLHFHTDLLHFPLIHEFTDRAITTLHGRLDLPDLRSFYQVFADVPLVSVSNDQRRPMPPVNWSGTVYHGLPPNLLPFTDKPNGNYLAFLGRIAPEKRPDRAIEIAKRAGMPLKIAAKIDAADKTYWETVIEPMIKGHQNVEFIGEINDDQKADFLGNAGALLFPIDWPEPFGLVMIEAMACGTPVIAFRRGSVPEVIDNDVSGILVDNVAEAAANVEWALKLDRRGVRGAFEKRFTAERMATDYLDKYRLLPGVRSNMPRLRHSDSYAVGTELIA
ncbi:glycosyl transferase [Rhizobium esperanzae]|uniref:Glycosyl transferase n=1 Tax=Rhizobium esperanzae TaxID=1967781 RepID=A0A246DPR6_9HYPH|nr:glycosyltransferase family 4 protein [Rhizobium esperanzae]OWO92271.1 glycosyl transferase [Rhizobium esperanzae]